MEYFDSIHELDSILINKTGLGIIMYAIDLLSIKNLKKIQLKLSSIEMSDNLVFLKNKILSRLNNI